MFIKRNYTSEIMDDFSIKDERIDGALKELKIINKYLGGISTTKAGLKKIINKNNFPDLVGIDSYNSKIKILDAASGAGDILEPLKEKLLLENYYFDINPRVCYYIKTNSNNNNIFCCDAFQLPFKTKFDVIHTSLFLHHLNEEKIIKLLKIFLQNCNNCIIINDLRRNVFALIGIKILTSIFSKSKMVKNDAPLSVKRGFIKKDIKNILKSLKIKNFEIKRKWAFRWLIIIYV